jgi:hypothetical protein
MEKPTSEDTSNAPSVERKKKQPRALQRRPQPTYDDDEDSELDDFVIPPPRKNRRMVPVHQSRIADRPIKKGAEDSSLKIKIELDLEVEVRYPASPIPCRAIFLIPLNAGRNLCQSQGRHYNWADVMAGRTLCQGQGRHHYWITVRCQFRVLFVVCILMLM